MAADSPTRHMRKFVVENCSAPRYKEQQSNSKAFLFFTIHFFFPFFPPFFPSFFPSFFPFFSLLFSPFFSSFFFIFFFSFLTLDKMSHQSARHGSSQVGRWNGA